jgi:lipopolysaccharide transport system permease protein
MSENAKEQTLLIKPKKNLFDINFIELWHYRDLIKLMVRRDFVAQNKQTVLGPLWFVITPLVSVLVYAVVFKGIAGISTEGIPPILFYMTGLTLWGYFSGTLSATSNVFVANAAIFGKVYFPRLVSPISVTISSIFRFLVQMGLLLVILICYSIGGYNFHFSIYTLLIPVVFLIATIFALGVGIIISSLTTKYRDFRNILALVIQLWMYATPIIYPVSIIPEKFRWISEANPMTPLIEAFKFGIIGVGTVSTTAFLYSAIVSIVILSIGVLMFNKVENTFMDTV